jgi:hypothetical protein
MFRLLFGLGVVVVILTVYTLVDCALFDRNRIRGVPRWVWILMIIFLPVLGAVLWLLIGRGRRSNSGSTGGRVTRSIAPDDDPDFLRGLDRAKTDNQRILDLERELADLDSTDAPDSGPAAKPGTAGADPKKTEPGEGDQPGRQDA